MTPDEAKKVLELLLSVDHGCYQCAYDLVRRFSVLFPQFRELGKIAFKNKFEIAIDEFRK